MILQVSDRAVSVLDACNESRTFTTSDCIKSRRAFWTRIRYSIPLAARGSRSVRYFSRNVMRTSSSLAVPHDVVRFLTSTLQVLICFFGRHSSKMLRAALSLRDATLSLCMYSMSSFLFAPSI